jgi:CRP/FNR family cyclic AMP-dependent transcriptional regulator
MSEGALGKVYQDGEIIVRQGDPGDSMFVVQSGQVQVLAERDGEETLLNVVREGELLGEMAIFDQKPRSATLRALGETKILTIDKKNFMRRINEDPTIAFRIVETMSQRVRELSDEVVRLKAKI